MNVKNIKLSELVNPHAKQREFLEVIKRCAYVLYGGAAGGGKSFILQWFAVLCIIKAFVIHGVRGAKFGLFCETYQALKDRHLSAWKIPSWLGEIKDTATEGLRFKLRDDLGGGMVLLRNLDEPSKYDSAEFIGVAVDEWCRNPWSVFDELRKRLRWPMVAEEPHLPCGGRCASRLSGTLVECPIDSHHREPAWNFPFAMGSNPGGLSHAETKRIFIDRQFPENLLPLADQFAFVQAKSSDNPYNPPDYKAKNLDTLKGRLREAYAEGNWNIFAGQYFPNFDPARRVVPYEIGSQLIKPWWPRWISSDWGHAHFWVTQWHSVGMVTPQEAAELLGRDWKEQKRIAITYREFARNEMSERAYAEEMVAQIPKSADGKLLEKYSNFFLSPDSFGERKLEHKHSIAHELHLVLKAYGIPPPARADNSRVSGWQFCFGLIEDDSHFITSNCEVLPSAIPVLKRIDADTGNPEDVEKTDDITDDSADCWRYGMKSMLSPEAAPVSVQIAEQLAQIEDPTAKYLTHLKLQQKYKQRNKPVTRFNDWRNRLSE